MPRATSNGTRNRSVRRMVLYIPMCCNEFRDFAGASPFHFEYWIAFYLLGGLMRYFSRGSAIVLALLALGASVASAQHPQTRKGFWIGLGLGYGSYGISNCTGCGRTGSVSGY